MNYLICEGNFVSFLSAVYDSYYQYKDSDMITSDKNCPSLLDININIEEDVEKARKVKQGIIKKGGIKIYDLVCDAYRAGFKNKEQIIFNFLKKFFKFGKDILEMFSDEDVIAFNSLCNRVWHETNRLTGFIRLREMSNGIYYGFYSSDNDILEKLMPDFVRRFNTQRFVLHDYKRCKMAFFDGENIRYSIAPKEIEIQLSKQEEFFSAIWKQYFETVSIEQRQNLRLQRSFLPKKYRHFMNEF